MNDETQTAPPARSDKSQMADNVIAVLGPTNTGKTHYAVERMLAHESGMIGFPLRLLAREIYDRVVALRGAGSAALVTGEERIIPASPSYWISTVEAMPLDRRVGFLAVDEIQLCTDPERGHTFTSRLLHARGTQETLFLGALTMRTALRDLIPGIQFHSRARLSQLSYSGEKKVSRLPRRSAVIAFSAEQVYSLAELLRRQRGGAAVVMGALSPRTRNAQVALYQSGDVDFIVATDAIGMGLNMDIDHVAFSARRKFDGHQSRELKAHEIGQIAGRAGRYQNDGTFGVTGECLPFEPDLVDVIENHRFDPVRLLQWRNDDLDFSSLAALIESLETPPGTKSLVRARPAIDLTALKQLGAAADVEPRLTSETALRLLWSVCQIPDFQQTMIDDHVRLLAGIFTNLTDSNGKLPEDWLKGHVDRLDNAEGDIDALSARLAHIRTFTFISNRPGWLDQADHWRERTREIEDRLSDALHERLTQRFVDRRTSVLMKRLNADDLLNVTVDEEGEVAVEGEFVGRLSGFQFLLDPRVTETKSALEAKALRGAAVKALEPLVRRAAERLAAAAKAQFSLQDQGVIIWEGHPIARLKRGAHALAPRVELLASDMVADLLGSEGRERIVQRLEGLVSELFKEQLQPLLALRAAAESDPQAEQAGPIALGAERVEGLKGIARGLAFQIVENFGTLARARVADEVKSLSTEDRAALRGLGVRFGEFSIFVPQLLKPAQARHLVLLSNVASGLFDGEGVMPAPPPAGLTSLTADPAWSEAYLGAAGFRRCGKRAVRIDILERLGNLIRVQRFPDPVKASPPAQAGAAPSALPAAPEATPIAPPADGNALTPAPEIAAAETTGPVAVSAGAVDAGVPAASGTAPAPEMLAAQETAPAAPEREIPAGAFEIVPQMLSLTGCSSADFEEILKGLGYRASPFTTKAGVLKTIWRQPRPGGDRRRDHRGERRAAPAEAAAAKPEGSRRERRFRKGGGDNPRTEQPAAVMPPAVAAKGNEDAQTAPHQQHRRDGKKRHSGKGGRKGGPEPRDQRQERRPERAAVYDKDSPFAVLAQLKGSLTQK